MKKLMLACALAGLSAFGQQNAPGAANSPDPQKFPDEMTLAYLNKALVAEETSLSAVAYAPEFFTAAGKESELRALAMRLGQTLIPENRAAGVRIAEKDRPNLETIKATLSGIATLDGEFRPALRQALSTFAMGEFGTRISRIQKTQSFLEILGYERDVAEIDAACRQFLAMVAEMERNKADKVYGTELMMASGLDKFANADCRKSPRYDKFMRNLDSYLSVMREDRLRQLEDDLNSLNHRYTRAKESLDRAKATIQNGKVPPKINNLLRLYDKILDSILAEMDAGYKVCEVARSAGTATGKLRKLTPVAASGVLLAVDTLKDDGCPVYTRRLRLALQECKERYLQAARKINPPDPSGRPFSWQ